MGGIFLRLNHSIFQTEVQFNAPIQSGHPSGMAGNQSNHPQGNPALADTHIIQDFPPSWGDRGSGVHAGDAKYRSSTVGPDWHLRTSDRWVFDNLDKAKQSIENEGKYWIDRISPKGTPTTKKLTSGGNAKEIVSGSETPYIFGD